MILKLNPESAAICTGGFFASELFLCGSVEKGGDVL